MTQSEINQAEMIKHVIFGFFKDEETFCNSVPALKILRKKIILNYGKIKESSARISCPSRFRNMKLDKRKELCDSAYIVSSGLMSHATLTKNNVLENVVNYCFSDFYRSTEPTMLARCKQILRTARRTKNLSFVGLTDGLLNELDEKIKKYEELMVIKDVSKAEIKKHNRIISKSLKECMHLFETGLHPLMRVLVKTNFEETKNFFYQSEVHKKAGRKKKRNKNRKSEIKTVKSNILQQKSSEEILHRFAELAVSE